MHYVLYADIIYRNNLARLRIESECINCHVLTFIFEKSELHVLFLILFLLLALGLFFILARMVPFLLNLYLILELWGLLLKRLSNLIEILIMILRCTFIFLLGH